MNGEAGAAPYCQQYMPDSFGNDQEPQAQCSTWETFQKLPAVNDFATVGLSDRRKELRLVFRRETETLLAASGTSRMMVAPSWKLPSGKSNLPSTTFAVRSFMAWYTGGYTLVDHNCSTSSRGKRMPPEPSSLQ